MVRAKRTIKQDDTYIPQSLRFILWVLTKTGDLVLWGLTFLLKALGVFLNLTLRFCLLIFKIILRAKPHSPNFKISSPVPKLKPKIPKTEIIFAFPFRFKIRYFTLGFLVAIFFFFLPTLFYSWFKELPSPHLLASREIPQTTKIYDRSGNLLYEIYAEQNRTLIQLAEIPNTLKQATIAIEDKDFYRHRGFDPRSILRAAKENLTRGEIQGGSTITQQLIKSALLTPELSLRRKLKEVVLAFWAERIYPKDQILQMYLNQVPYGGTSWGVEAAAQTYFGKKARDLDLAETALLAGLPAAPTSYSPFGAHPELARERQEEVLRRMVEDNYITEDQAQKARDEKLNFVPQRTTIKAPHFVMYVRDQLVKKYGERVVERGGLTVITTLDLNLQEKVQEIVQAEIENLKNLQVGNGAAIVTNPKTGEILAMVGSKDYFDQENDGNVNVTLALRQPGSAIKVVNYAVALQNGFTPATILDDSPITYQIPGSEPYAPVNYDGQFHGRLPLRYALANSYNVPAVKVLEKIGVKKMVEMGRKMGISSWDDDSRFGLSLTLGGGDVTMFEMTKVYGVLANSGKRVETNPILEIKDSRGETLEKTGNHPQAQVVPEGVSFLISHILADNNARTSAFGPTSSLFIPDHTVSVKTGTTNGKRDNWTIGYTSFYLVAAWVGNNDNSPMNPNLTSGVTGAAPIWRKIMDHLLAGKPDEPLLKPEDTVEAKICAFNGLLSCGGCPAVTEYFLKGTEPKTSCQNLPSPAPPSD
ncbi:MAG: transglycosylase domain-containing protein [bacterium]|nr:transglycosylase domain-containing protein [bacterium]